MNALQKIAIKTNCEKMLPNGEKLLKTEIDINNVKGIATVLAIGETEEKKLEFAKHEFSEFGKFLTANLKKIVKFDTLDRVQIFVDFVGNETFYRLFYTINNEKKFFETGKI